MIIPQKRWLFLLGASYTTAEILGPLVPAPTDLTSESSLVAAAWKNLSSTFDSYLKDGVNSTSTKLLAGADNITWSAGMFSVHDPEASGLQYHWTAKEIADAVNGTSEVDGDSIYRGASITKLVTAYAGMLQLSPKQWNTPITELIPGLGEGGEADDPLSATQWDKITPWALANQQSGAPTFGIPVFDLIATYAIKALQTNTSLTELETADGFPAEPISSLGPCTDIENPICEADDFLASAKTLHANLLPWTTPAYSNFGLMLLGLAISNATGKSYDEIYTGGIFEPLRMESTSVSQITVGEQFERSVILGPTLEQSGFYQRGSLITSPSGGLLTTINDLAKLGAGIANSTLLSSEQTRQWMKPHGHTASMTLSIGAPWEIVRFIHPTSGRVTDIYTKLGDSGNYGGILAIIPDYNAGFSFLNAASDNLRGQKALNIINVIAETIVPALEAQAIAEAQQNFVGEYECEETNSSITISFNDTTIVGPSAPSLSISRWNSNGTDMLPVMFKEIQPQLQLVIPKQSEGAGAVAFEGYTSAQYNSYVEAGLGPFSGFYESNFGWAGEVDRTSSRYAGNNAKLFVFNVGAEGKAGSVVSAGTRATMKRVSGSEGTGEGGRTSDYIRRGLGAAN